MSETGSATPADPARVAVTLGHARSRQKSGDLASAEQACRELLARADLQEAAPVEALLALCLLQLNRRGEALPLLARARDGRIEDTPALSDLGGAILLSGETRAAATVLARATSNADAGAVDFNRLATAHLMLGDVEAAAQAYRRATELRPAWAAAWSNLAGTQLRLQRPEEALANYDRAIALEPGNAMFDDNRNVALVALGRGSEALTDLEEALAREPQSPDLHRRIAQLHALADQDREAEAHFQAAVRLDPADRASKLQLAEIALQSGRPADARRLLDAALAEMPSNAGVRALLASVQIGLGLGRLAEDNIARLHADEPDSLACRLLRSQLATERGDHERARMELSAAVARFPDASDAQMRLGETLMWLGRLDEAVACFDNAARINPACLAALAELRALPEDPALVEHMAGLARNPLSARPVRSALHFALCKLFDRNREHARAFEHAEAGNRIERIGVDFSAARQRAAIDRIIEAFPAALFERLRGSGRRNRRPIFICGMPRSGTTLAEQVIAAHPSVHGAGELSAIPRIAAGMHRHLGTAVSWPLCMELFTADTARALARHYLDVIDGLAPDAAHVVDKLPHNFMYLGLIALMFPQAAIVHLDRHPGDVALSNFFTNYKHKHGAMGYALDVGDIAATIRDHDRLMAHWRRVLPGRIYELGYEALVADFDGESRRLYEHLGLDWRSDVRDFHELDRPIRTGSVWQVRQPLYSSSVGRWRDYAEGLAPLGDLLARRPRARRRARTAMGAEA